MAAEGPDRVKTRTPGRQFMNFSRFSAFSAITGPGRTKKFAPDAPFSDNFRVFTRSGSISTTLVAPEALDCAGGGCNIRRSLTRFTASVPMLRHSILQDDTGHYRE